MEKIFRAGKLFLWEGKQQPTVCNIPQKVLKASVGPDHVIAIGQSGNLYTTGNGQYGKLGHGDTKSLKDFKLVEYFSKKDIKVKDAVCGQRHTIVLSEKGDVYTFGAGKKDVGLLMKLFVNSVGPTGHGPNAPSIISKPTKIKALQDSKTQRITAGRNFCITLNSKNEIYNWGNGEYAAFGDGNNKNYDTPVLNKHFEYLKSEEKFTIKKVKSAESYSVALMENGKLYGWGSNEHGQMGIKSQIGVEMYETVNFVTEVIREGYENQKVVNFDISENTLIFQLDNDALWWSGMKIAYKPEILNLNVKPKLFAASRSSLAVVDDQNNIYSKNGFLEFGAKPDVNAALSGLTKFDGSSIFSGEIVGIGGQYSNRYAIVV